jgi:hypothetical protein
VTLFLVHRHILLTSLFVLASFVVLRIEDLESPTISCEDASDAPSCPTVEREALWRVVAVEGVGARDGYKGGGLR